MQAPVCEDCIRSGVLCPECKKKLEDKRISEFDIELAALLYEMESQELVRNPSFEKVFSVDDLLLVLTRGDVANMIGKRGRVVRQLSKKFKKTVRIIKDEDLKTKMSDLVAPARLLGINVVYKGGEQETKVLVAEEDRNKLVAGIPTIEKAAQLLSNDENLKVEFK